MDSNQDVISSSIQGLNWQLGRGQLFFTHSFIYEPRDSNRLDVTVTDDG